MSPPMLASLPEALSSLFGENPATGQYAARLYSSVDVREVEQALAEYGVSYQTKIVRSRKRGVCFVITLLEDGDVYA